MVTLFILLFVLQTVASSSSSSRPLVIGHRGTAYLPESTLAAQSMAHAYGADIIEIDVCLSRDDQLIVIHDIYLDGLTNVREIFRNRSHSNGLNYVTEFTLSELRQLRVHERVVPGTNESVFPLRFPSNSKVPFQLSTLNETIELLLGLNRATGRQRQLLIEIKKPEYHFDQGKSISAIVLATLNAYNLSRATDPIIIQTFHIEELMHIRQDLLSQLRLFALMTWNRVNESSSDYDYYRSEQGIRNLSSIVQALAPDYELVVNFDTSGRILNATDLTRWAHQYNLSVYPYSFRQDRFPGGSFQELVEYFWHTVQVDGFITDHSDVLLELLQSKPISMGHVMFPEHFCFYVFVLVVNFVMP